MMRIVFVFLFCFGVFGAGSQNWLRKGGGLSQDEALDIASDGEGHVYLTGYVSSSASMGPLGVLSAGASDVVVAKVSAQGDPIWMKSFGGPLADRGSGVAVDGDGNVLVTGFFRGVAQFGSFELTAAGGQPDVFVMKLSAAGDVLWAVSCGGPGDDFSHDVVADSGGNVWVTGQFKESAVFGPFGFTSQADADTGLPTFDVFIAKLSPGGEWLLVKHGTNDKDSRGLSLGADGSGHVYAGGQFSNDLVFTETYTNNVLNAGYLMKLDGNGNELWFVRFSASQTMCYDMHVSGDGTLHVTGDYMGQMAVMGSSVTVIPYTHLYNIFVMKFSASGVLQWAVNDGSENPLTSRGIDLGAQGEIYVAGTFRCSFTELAEENDSGVFYSVGYGDVFVSRFSPEGVRMWSRHFGGQYDDWCAGIVRGVAEDNPFVAGSFAKNFNVPSNNSFGIFPDNNPMECGGLDAGSVSQYCGQGSNYYQYVSVVNAGNRDIFYGAPVHLGRLPYDYFSRSGVECERPYRDPCISKKTGPLVPCSDNPNACDNSALTGHACQDTIHFCVGGNIAVKTHLFCENRISPIYEMIWDNGSEEHHRSVNQSGTYTVSVSRQDYCDSWELEVHVEVHPLPEAPLISDDIVLNTLAGPGMVQSYTACQDTVTITASGICEGCSYSWGGGGAISIDDTVKVTASTGFHELTVTDQWGCQSSNGMYLTIHQPMSLPDLDLDIKITHGGQLNPDTIWVCQGGSFSTQIFDINGVNFNNFDSVLWEKFLNGSPISSNTSGSSETSTVPTATGLYTIQGTLTLQWSNSCGSGVVSYPILEKSVFVYFLPAPPISVSISGTPNPYCPGDAVTLTAFGAQSYTWSGPGIIDQSANNIVVVNHQGTYTAAGQTVYDNGCVKNHTMNYTVTPFAHPVVFMTPVHGTVCPGDSVLLTCEPGLAYEWIGPTGEFLGNTQSVWVDSPGFYFCTQTNFSGCTLESNFVEVKEYSSPFLIAEPGTDLCVNGNVTLTVESNDFSTFEWNHPEWGSENVVVVNEPGTWTCTVSFCGFSTELTVNVTLSDTPSFITVTDTLICPGQTTTLQGNPGMVNYSWSNGMYGQSIQVSEPGVYTLTTMDLYGCFGGSEPVEVFGYSIEAPQTVGAMVCPGESATVSATSPYPIHWASNVQGTDIIGTGPSIEINDVTQTTTVYAFGQDDVCTSLGTAAVVSINPSSIVPEITGDTLYCVGDAIVLQAQSNPGLQFQWTGPTNSFMPWNTFTIPNAGLSQTGWYTVSITNQECPTPSTSVYVTVMSYEPSLLVLMTPAVICEGDPIHITSQADGDEYQWTLPSGEIAFGQDLHLNAASVENSGTFTLHVLGNFCPNPPDSVVVTVMSHEPSTLMLLTEPEICDGEAIHLISLTDGPIQQWTTPSGQLVYGQELIINPASPNDSGLYILETQGNFCPNIPDSIVVWVNPAPVFSADSFLVGCVGEVMTVWVNDFYAQYLWTTGVTTPENPVDLVGWHGLTVWNEFGCAISDSLFVDDVNCSDRMFNIFTPNGDGVNDFYDFGVLKIAIEQVVIFNRWGTAVRTLGPSELRWGGEDNAGEPLPENVYYFSVSTKETAIQPGKLKGYVYLSRD